MQISGDNRNQVQEQERAGWSVRCLCWKAMIRKGLNNNRGEIALSIQVMKWASGYLDCSDVDKVNRRYVWQIQSICRFQEKEVHPSY